MRIKEISEDQLGYMQRVAVGDEESLTDAIASLALDCLHDAKLPGVPIGDIKIEEPSIFYEDQPGLYCYMVNEALRLHESQNGTETQTRYRILPTIVSGRFDNPRMGLFRLTDSGDFIERKKWPHDRLPDVIGWVRSGLYHEMPEALEQTLYVIKDRTKRASKAMVAAAITSSE
jgi:hypothetical protein